MPQASRSLKLFAALVALGLMSAPARAEVFDYSFNRWVADDSSIAGSGYLTSAARAVGVPVFLSNPTVTLTSWVAITPFGGPVFCNIHPETCRPAVPPESGIHGSSGPLTITRVEWLSFGSGLPGLLFQVTGWPDLFSVPGNELTLGLATPGPIAGTGLPVLAGLLAAARLFRRRSYSAS